MSSSALPKKNFFTQEVIPYLNTANGASDLLDAVSIGAQYVQLFPLSLHNRQTAHTIASGFGAASCSLYFVDLITDGNKLLASAQSFCKALYFRNIQKVTVAFKQFSYDFLTVVAEVIECAMYTFSLFGKILPAPLRGLCSGAWLFTDLADFKGQLAQFEKNERELRTEKSVARIQALHNSNTYTLLKSARTLSSVGTDVLGLASLYYLASASFMAVALPLFLGFSTVFLVTTVASALFQQHIERKHGPLPLM